MDKYIEAEKKLAEHVAIAKAALEAAAKVCISLNSVTYELDLGTDCAKAVLAIDPATIVAKVEEKS